MAQYKDEGSFFVQMREPKVSIWKAPGYSDLDCPEDSAGIPDSPEPRLMTKDPLHIRSSFCNEKFDYHAGVGSQILLNTSDSYDEFGNAISKPKSIQVDVNYFGHKELTTFYEVTVPGPQGMVTGWIEADRVSQPESKYRLYQRGDGSEVCATDDLPIGSNPIEGVRAQALKLADIVLPNKIELKNEKEVDRFVCLHRASSKEGELEAFLKNEYPKFKKNAEDASAAFGIPKQVLLCSLLAETSFKPGQISSANARGYAQVMPNTMDTIQKLPATRPIRGNKSYGEMWKEYTQHPSSKDAALTNSKVRLEDHIPSNVGAMALHFRYLYDQFVVTSKEKGLCKDCSGDITDLNRKDLYLMLIAYNGGQGYVDRVATKSNAQLHRENPPPAESNKYIDKIEKCLSEGKEVSFSDSISELERTNRQRASEVQQLKKEISQLESAHQVRMDAYQARQKSQEKQKAMAAAAKTNPKIKVPGPVKLLPLPTPPTAEIKRRKDQIQALEEQIKLESSASYGNRYKFCDSKFPKS